jgi:hypothetical protein
VLDDVQHVGGSWCAPARFHRFHRFRVPNGQNGGSVGWRRPIERRALIVPGDPQPESETAPGKGIAAAKVKEWLRTQGYPLEFATARTLRAAGFDARQGRSYMDVTATGGRVREIDVLAPLREVDQDVSVALVAECKYTVGKPWVVLTGTAFLKPADVLEATIASDNVRPLLVGRARNPNVRGVPQFLEIPERHGFSVVTAFRTQDQESDASYRAMSQVVGAARNVWVAVTSQVWKLVWPVVVIEGQLFETQDDGGEDVQEVGRSRIMWHGASAARPVVVDVVTVGELEAYAQQAYGALQGIQNLLGEKAYEARREAGEPR